MFINNVKEEFMELNTYQELVTRSARQADTKELYSNFGLGIAGEAGEVADYIKKILYHGFDLEKDKLKKELGDVMWYVSMIAKTADMTLESVAIANIEKLQARYPEGFSTERSKNRKD
jgi:NTP pyrophosphatase (non-canonical NTP hydrolase)